MWLILPWKVVGEILLGHFPQSHSLVVCLLDSGEKWPAGLSTFKKTCQMGMWWCRALQGCSSYTLDDKWMLKDCFKRITAPPRGHGREAERPVQPHYPARVDLSAVKAHDSNAHLRRAFLLREVSLLIPSVSWGRRRPNRQSIKLLPKLSVLKK